VGATQVSLSLLAFLVIYAIVFCVGVLYILRLIAEGPISAAVRPQPRPRPPGWSLGASPHMEGLGEEPGEDLGEEGGHGA
jgi:cytochrome d ubiquinol oxidase subunit I